MLRRTLLSAVGAAAAMLALSGAAMAQDSAEDRPDPADDRAVRLDRPPDRGGGEAVHAAEGRYGRRQEDPTHRQGRYRHRRRHQAPRAGADRQRQDRRHGGLRADAAGSRVRAPGDAGEGAGSGHGGGHLDHHGGLALHRPHELHPASGHRADGRLGGAERHQEGRHARFRLRPGHRRREGFHRRLHRQGRAGREPAGAARRIPTSRPSCRRWPTPSPMPCSSSCPPASAPSS